jgi:hypothetical protein
MKLFLLSLTSVLALVAAAPAEAAPKPATSTKMCWTITDTSRLTGYWDVCGNEMPVPTKSGAVRPDGYRGDQTGLTDYDGNPWPTDYDGNPLPTNGKQYRMRDYNSGRDSGGDSGGGNGGGGSSGGANG